MISMLLFYSLCIVPNTLEVERNGLRQPAAVNCDTLPGNARLATERRRKPTVYPRRTLHWLACSLTITTRTSYLLFPDLFLKKEHIYSFIVVMAELADHDYVAGAKKKRKFTDQQRQAKKALDIARNKTRVNIGRAFNRWREFRDQKGFKTDYQVAVFLLDRYVLCT